MSGIINLGVKYKNYSYNIGRQVERIYFLNDDKHDGNRR